MAAAVARTDAGTVVAGTAPKTAGDACGPVVADAGIAPGDPCAGVVDAAVPGAGAPLPAVGPVFGHGGAGGHCAGA
jgi:hypothetical protein